MKRLFFVLLATVLLPRMAAAQQKMFGYFSYEEAIKTMPEYVLVQENLNDLKSKYDQEMKRVEDEFNRKYEDFLDGRSDFAPTILQKRQTELQELLKKNVAFKAEAQRLLQQAEVDALAPLKKKLQGALDKIGAERGYAFILNTDGDACPYINPEMGEDVSLLIKEAVR
jgi:outer membrane protein